MRPSPDAALLFDIDGTLADTDPLHLEAFNRIMEPYGHAFDAAGYARELQGHANSAIAARFLPHLSPEEGMAILLEKERLYRELARSGIDAVPGLLALLDHADALGIRMAAVTNAPRANADLVVDSLGIRHRFKAIVSAAELAQSKPHPLPYLEGLLLLGARPEVSIAFEDSRAGITSAVTAGLATVGVRTSLADADLRAVGAVFSIDSYEDPAIFELVDQRTANAAR